MMIPIRRLCPKLEYSTLDGLLDTEEKWFGASSTIIRDYYKSNEAITLHLSTFALASPPQPSHWVRGDPLL